jgi:GMP synthase (glutamine-hydrolysing)
MSVGTWRSPTRVQTVKPILVIEQEILLAGQGVLGERLAASGLPVRSLRTWEEGFDGLRATEFSAIVPLGSNASAWQESDLPFLTAERELLADAVEQDVPVLGICFGAQLLARALGSEVYAGEEPEIGWCEITPTSEARDDRVIGHADGSTGTFQFHMDTFSLPEGAVRLASSERYENQAFRIGSAWGVQFHPEADYRQFSIWAANHVGYLEKLGIEERTLHEQVQRGSANRRDRLFRERLFDAFLEVVEEHSAEAG